MMENSGPDPKPEAPEGIRSRFGSIASSLPGLPVCEHLPETAKVLHKVTLIHSVHHTMKNHNSASYYALTGHAPPVDDIRLRDSLELFPAYGSVVDRFAPSTGGMPTFVAYPHVIRDGAVTPGQHASFLGKRHDPLLVTDDPADADFKLPELSLPASLDVARLQAVRTTKVDDGMVEVSVIDQGIGIPSGELDRIFERFYRVDPARHRSTGGTGIGLSIVKHVAATHGGDIRVWSAEGQGSTFTLTLPRAHHGEPT